MYSFKKYAYLFSIPALFTITLFALYPVLHSLFLSFCKLDLRDNLFTFAWIDNYKILLNDVRTHQAFYNTLFFTVSSVILELLLGLLIALAVIRKFKGVGITRALSMVPWAIPAVVAALLWRWIFNDRFGLLNEILLRMDIIHMPKAFLSSPFFSRLAVIFCEVWKTTPFMAILLLAGLQMIPDELYESAKVDGANVWQRFWLITVPLLKPAILVALLFRTMDALRIFDTVFILTGGGPGNSTETLSVYTYKTMFSHLELGMGSALAVLTFLVVAIVSIVYIFTLKKIVK